MRRIQPISTTDSVLASLAEYIEESGLSVGDRLPAERDIAQQLGVSRPMLREALGRWSALGLVETRNGRGTYLRAPISARSRHVVLTVDPERQTLLQTLELRRALETEAAALAAERATPEQVAELERLLAAVEAAYERVGDAPAEDWAFHLAVYQATGNPLFAQFIEGILAMFHRFWENPLQRPDFARRGLAHHRTLVERIRDRDPQGAREAVLSILQVLQEELEM